MKRVFLNMCKGNQVLRILLFAAIILCAGSMVYGSGWLSINGYYKSYFTAYDYTDVDYFFSGEVVSTEETPLNAAVNNRIRLKTMVRITNYLSIIGAYDFSPRVKGDEDSGTAGFLMGRLSSVFTKYRVDDIRYRLYPEPCEPMGNFGIYQNLDRLFLTVNSRFADFYIGRQAIAWGSARVINPTDILAPYAFNELDIEDRIGVDAVRMRVPVGFMGEIDAGYVFGEDFEYKNSAMFLRGKFYYRRNDISLMAVNFRENLMLGIDWTRSIGGAGFWLEGAYVFDDAFSTDERDSEYDYFRATIGGDYSLRDGTYLFMEYHYNGAGANDIDEWLSGPFNQSYRLASGYLAGQHYLAPGIGYQITPLIILNGQMLANLSDPSLFLMPSIEYNIAENIYLSGGAYLGFGRPIELVFSENDVEVRYNSEFGNYPDYYFTSFRIYF
ncbi:MAG: hypothetical protein DRP46_01400 [Candidatus Zixiibacteriota bacterium]|nr:MAG: hypothetical protein DRP46_01400 [candidate division Zixibacteria bacterium]